MISCFDENETSIVSEKIPNSSEKSSNEVVNNAIETETISAVDYYNRGTSKMRLKNYNEALIYFNRAIELDPNILEAHINRGLVKVRRTCR